MAKVVCEDCGEVVAEGVSQEEAEELADQHGHGDDPDRIVDRSGPEEYDTEGGGGFGGDQVINPDATEARREIPVLDERDRASGEGAPDREGTDTTRNGDGGDTGLAEEIEEIEELDDERDPTDWWGVTGESDPSDISDEFVRRFERIQDEIEHDRSEIGQCIEDRDRRLSDRDAHYTWGNTAEHIRSQEKWRQLRDDVQDAFRRLKSRDTRTPSRKGDDLNMQAINQRAAGDKSKTRLFTRKRQVAKGDRAVGVATDFSGSMDEADVKMALSAIAEATEIIGDDLVANAWAKRSQEVFGLRRSETTIGVVCGPDEDFEMDNLDAFGVGGGTPTADGIDQLTDMLEGMTAREKVAIVVTDGKPNVEYGGGSWDERLTGDATKDAARVTREARQEGMKVIGLGVGGVNESQMAEIFGQTGYVMGSMDDLAEKLVEVYRRQLRVD